MTLKPSPTDEAPIKAREFAEIAGLRYPSELNRLRRENEEYWSIEQRAWLPMPRQKAAYDRVAETAPVVVCRLLGGLKLGKGDWRYRPEVARAIRSNEPAALSAILQRDPPGP